MSGTLTQQGQTPHVGALSLITHPDMSHMGHIDVEIWFRWVPPVNRRGRSTLGLDDSVRGFLRETECVKVTPFLY